MLSRPKSPSLGELRQILVNLIANAIDALPKGGNLLLRTSPVRDPKDGRQGVSITVADDGQGILPDAQKRIFSPFFTTKGTTGTGLGLWLTRDILEHQRGYIRCRNHRSPHGAVFTIWLPLSHRKCRNSGNASPSQLAVPGQRYLKSD